MRDPQARGLKLSPEEWKDFGALPEGRPSYVHVAGQDGAPTRRADDARTVRAAADRPKFMQMILPGGDEFPGLIMI
jgi:hypothetical protein